MGMLLALGFMWVLTTVLYKGNNAEEADELGVAHALRRVDTPSILFFWGYYWQYQLWNQWGF